MLPTVRTLRHIHNITDEQARAVRRALEGPGTAWTRLEAAAAVLPHASGVERIPPGRTRLSPSVVYVNLGDPYRPTLLYVRGRFRVGDWGTLVERGSYD